METYIEFKHNGSSYRITIKAAHRKVKWVKVFLRQDNTIFLDEILPVKITTSTRTEEATYWLHNLKRKLSKKRSSRK